ncbi:MAG: hypothetical protein RL708_1653 [Bacteroidota bacterium]|jgi:hypothetical protein
MKKQFTFLLLFFCLISSILFAQSSSTGIYLTAKDFQQHKISFASSPQKKYKISVGEIFYSPLIKISSGDSTIKLSKNVVYGYRNADNISFRFFNKNEFEILNPMETILLYKLTVAAGARGSATVTKYFFSKDASSPIVPLSIYNLQKVFANDASFQEWIAIYFHSDDELLKYDAVNKMYQLNHVFQISKTNILNSKR